LGSKLRPRFSAVPVFLRFPVERTHFYRLGITTQHLKLALDVVAAPNTIIKAAGEEDHSIVGMIGGKKAYFFKLESFDFPASAGIFVGVLLKKLMQTEVKGFQIIYDVVSMRAEGRMRNRLASKTELNLLPV